MEQTSSGQGDDGNPPNISQNHTQAGAQEPRTTNHLTNGNQPNGIVNGIVETSSPEVAGSPVIAQPVVGPPSQEPVVNHDQHPRRTSRHHLILPSPLSLLRRSRQNPRPVATSPAQQFDNPPQPPNEEEEHILNIHSVPPSTISPIPISPPQSESLLHTLSIRPPIPSYQSASTQTSTPQGILLEASTAAVSRIVPASPGSSQAECSVPAQLEPDATAPQSPDLTPRTPRGAVSRTCTTTPHLPITTPKGSGEKPSSPSTTSEISRQSTATAGFPIYISINQVAQPTSSFVANIQPTVMATYVALAQPQQQGCYYYYPGYQGQVFTTAPPGFRSNNNDCFGRYPSWYNGNAHWLTNPAAQAQQPQYYVAQQGYVMSQPQIVAQTQPYIQPQQQVMYYPTAQVPAYHYPQYPVQYQIPANTGAAVAWNIPQVNNAPANNVPVQNGPGHHCNIPANNRPGYSATCAECNAMCGNR